MEISPYLWMAAEDLRYLLNQGYPRDASLTLIGNRYNLDHDHRHLLRRGVFPASVAGQRRNKKVSLEEIRGKAIGRRWLQLPDYPGECPQGKSPLAG